MENPIRYEDGAWNRLSLEERLAWAKEHLAPYGLPPVRERVQQTLTDAIETLYGCYQDAKDATREPRAEWKQTTWAYSEEWQLITRQGTLYVILPRDSNRAERIFFPRSGSSIRAHFTASDIRAAKQIAEDWLKNEYKQ